MYFILRVTFRQLWAMECRLTPGGWMKKREILKGYDSAAHTYEKVYSEEQIRKYETVIGEIKIEKPHHVLDCGCGTGLFIERILEKTNQIVGVDYSIRMLEKARGKFKLKFNVNLIRADADFLPIKNEVFERVFSFTLLPDMPNPKLTLEELQRVSKGGSVHVISALKRAVKKEDFTSLLKEAKLEMEKLVDEEETKDFVAVCRKPIA
jgi:ubiquinone/menaquinone biosynthesis C-methylase UbiE